MAIAVGAVTLRPTSSPIRKIMRAVSLFMVPSASQRVRDVARIRVDSEGHVSGERALPPPPTEA
jgi:hypothetical protein